MSQKTKSTTVPATMQPRYAEIVALLDAFCTTHLNKEYAEVCQQMTATLARKRPSPLVNGKANTWAAGILHAVGTVNFVFDKTQTPHIHADDLSTAFGVGKSTASSKSKQIRDLLDVTVFDPDWTLPSRLQQNPRAWLIMVNGFIIDARSAPRHIQEEAFNKGLIPYLPNAE